MSEFVCVCATSAVCTLCDQMYERLSKLKSPHGVTVDKCIQPSVDNKGDIIGLVAGDPECYDVSTIAACLPLINDVDHLFSCTQCSIKGRHYDHADISVKS